MMRDRKAFYSWALVGAYSVVMSAVQRFQLSALAAFWSNEGGCNSNMTTSISQCANIIPALVQEPSQTETES